MYFNVIAGSEEKINNLENPIIANFYNDFQKYIFRHNDAIFSFRLDDEKLANVFTDANLAVQVREAIIGGNTQKIIDVFSSSDFFDHSFMIVYITEIALRENLPIAILQQHLDYIMPFTDGAQEEKARLLLLFLIKHAYAVKDGPSVQRLAEKIFEDLSQYAPEEQNHVIVFYYLYSSQKNDPELMNVIESYLQREFLLGRNIETMGGVIFLALVLSEYYCEKHCYNKAEELLTELEDTVSAIKNTGNSFKEAYHLDELFEYNAKYFTAFYYLMTEKIKKEQGADIEIYRRLSAELSVKKLYDSYYAAKNTNNIDFAGNWIDEHVKGTIVNFFKDKQQRQRVSDLLAKIDQKTIEDTYYKYASLHESSLDLDKKEKDQKSKKEIDLSFLVSMIGLEAWNKMEVFAQENICRYLENYIVFRREFMASLNNNEHAVVLVNSLQKNKLFINQKSDSVRVLVEKICLEYLWHEDNFYPLVSFYAALDKNNKKTITDILQNYQDRNAQILLYKLLLDGNSAEKIILAQAEMLLNEYNVPAGLLALLNYKQQENSLYKLAEIKEFLINEFSLLPLSFKQIITKKRQHKEIEKYRAELLKEITFKIEKASLQHDIMLRRVREQQSDYEIFSGFVAHSEEDGVINNLELDSEIGSELDILEYVSLEKMPASGEIVIAPEVFAEKHPVKKLLKEIRHKIEKNSNGESIVHINIIGDELSFEAIFDVTCNDLKIINSPVAYDKTIEYLKLWLAKMWNNYYGLGDFFPENRQQRVAEVIKALVYPEKTKEIMQYVYNFNKDRVKYPFRFESSADNLFTSFHRLVGVDTLSSAGRRTEQMVFMPLTGVDSKDQIDDLSNIYQLGFVNRRPWRTNVMGTKRAVNNYIHFERLMKEKGFDLNVEDETEYYKIELAENIRKDQHLILDNESGQWKFTPTGWHSYAGDGRKIAGNEFERTYVMPHFRIYKVNER